MQMNVIKKIIGNKQSTRAESNESFENRAGTKNEKEKHVRVKCQYYPDAKSVPEEPSISPNPYIT